jgi:hypothetical protein
LRRRASDAFVKTNLVKKPGSMTKLPNFASNAALGLAATASSGERPLAGNGISGDTIGRERYRKPPETWTSGRKKY